VNAGRLQSPRRKILRARSKALWMTIRTFVLNASRLQSDRAPSSRVPRSLGMLEEERQRETSKQLQLQFHVEDALDRIGSVAGDLFESVGAVEGDGFVHGARDGVEAHVGVADLSRGSDDGGDELLSDVMSTEFRADVEALHFADSFARIECVKRDASGEGVVMKCEEQAAGWWRVVSGEFVEFFLKTLEAEVEVEG